jgi:hypothetical protein
MVPPKLTVMDVRDSQDSEYFLDLAPSNLELKRMDSHDYSVLNMDPIFANIDDRLATFSSEVKSPGVLPIDAKPKMAEPFNSESLVDYFSFQRSLNEASKIISIKKSQEKSQPELAKPHPAKGNNKENKSKNSVEQSPKDQAVTKKPAIMAKPDLKSLKSKAGKSKAKPPEEKIFKSKDNTLDSISMRRENTSLRYANYDSCSEEEPDELDYLTIVKQSDSKL